MAVAGYLKQSTTITISLGPFIDKDDGDTEKTGLTIEDTDIYLSKNGAAKGNPNDTNNCTEDANGVYRKQLNTTDTNTLGILTVYVHFTDCLYVKQDYHVVKANWYDTMFSTDVLESDLVQMGGTVQSATDLKDFADAGYDPATNKVEGVKLVDVNTDMVGTDNAALAATALSTANWTAARAGYLDELAAANLPADIDTILTRIIGTLLAGNHNAQGGDNFARLGAPAGASISADIADISTVAELNARTLPSADYFDPAADTVVNVTNCANNADMRGTDNAATEAKQDIIDTNVDAILVDTGTTLPAQIIALNDITVADIIAGIADGALDLQEMMRIILSALVGKTNTNGTIFRDSGDSKNRIVATLDVNNNRTNMVLDGS